jgi:predicted dehydrogenase
MESETMKRYKAAVIGAGRIGMRLESDPLRKKPATHAGTWLQNNRTQLVGLCDIHPGMPAAAAKLAPGVATYSDPERMLKEKKPDIVSIATHQDTHIGLIRIALMNGAKAIVCEKPISDDPVGAAKIVAEARSAGVPLIINHARRFDPTFQKLAHEIASGRIGEVLQVSGYYVYGLVSTGTHLVDTIRMLLRPVAGEIAWVAGWPMGLRSFHPQGDPNIDGVVGFANGLKATVQALNMKDYDFFEIDIFGREGLATCHGIGRRAAIYPVVESTINAGFTEMADDPVEQWGPTKESFFASMATNVIDCLDGRTTPASTGEDSLMALEVLSAMKASAERGVKIIL